MVKFGVRKPNLNKRIKARTTGRVKRAVKSSVNPTYGKKGVGWAKNPKRAAYNKVYNKTTIGVGYGKKNHSKRSRTNYIENDTNYVSGVSGLSIALGCSVFVLYIISIFSPWLFIAAIGLHIYVYKRRKNEVDQIEKKHAEIVEAENLRNYNKEVIDSFARTKWGIESLFEKMDNTNVLNTFFGYYEELEVWISLYRKKKENSKGRKVAAETIIEIEKLIDVDLIIHFKNFIKRYERVSLEKASKLKTEKGQKNNYRRSLEDLIEYEQYFDASIKEYINDRWQDI